MRPQHLDPVQFLPDATRILAQQPDHTPVRRMRQFAQQALGGIARADHQHRLSRQHDPPVQGTVTPRTIGKTTAAHRQNQQDGVEQQHRTRHTGQMKHIDRRGGNDRRTGHRHDDAAQVHQAGIAPDAAIKTKKPAGRDIADHHRDKRPTGAFHVDARHLQIEAKPVRQEPAKHHGTKIVQNR